MSQEDAVWSRSPGVAFVDDGDRIVLLNLAEPAAARPLLLTDVAVGVWRSLGSPRGLHDLADEVALSQPEDQAAAVRPVLEQLESVGLAVRS